MSEVRQMSMNFNKFWQIDGKVDEIVWYIYTHIFHLTWPTSLHYLFKRGCSKFLPNKWIYYSQIAQICSQIEERVTFLLKPTARHAQVVPGRDFVCVSTGRRPSASRTQHRRFPGARETRRRLSACFRVHAAYISSMNSDNFEPISWQLITLLKIAFLHFGVKIQDSGSPYVKKLLTHHSLVQKLVGKFCKLTELLTVNFVVLKTAISSIAIIA